jgi:serine/threonine protein kinase
LNSVPDNNSPKDDFERVFDEFVATARDGENPCVKKFRIDYPHFETEIEEHFPGFVLANKLASGKARNVDLEIELPFRLGKYELREEIGRGGMGVVYHAVHLELGTDSAIKVMACDSQGAANRTLRFKQEAKIVSSLHHRCIVPLLDYGFSDDLLYFVMRKIDGITFEQFFNQQHDGSAGLRSDWKLLASLFAEIAGGLEYIHQQGLIHRDIKPGNLLIDRESRVWISDFGLSKCIDSTRSGNITTGIVGTPKYIAPERTCGAHDKRSDIYSLGVTMFEAFSGIGAWSAECRKFECVDELLLPNLRRINPAIPKLLSKIVSKACMPRPSERYQTAGALAEDLRDFALSSNQGIVNRLLMKLGRKS